MTVKATAHWLERAKIRAFLAQRLEELVRTAGEARQAVVDCGRSMLFVQEPVPGHSSLRPEPDRAGRRQGRLRQRQPYRRHFAIRS